MPTLTSVEYVCVDVEATGLDVASDRILEVAAVRFTMEKILDDFESLINPECAIPKASQDIHNISSDMVSNSPKIADVLPSLLAFIGERPIVGHGISYDIDIICHEAKRAHLPCSLQNNITFDTLRLARLYGESPSNSLSTLRQHFNIQSEGAHRAKGDVIVNIQVFRFLTKKFRTTEQIAEALSRPIYMKNMPLGKHKGRPLRELPLDYISWASRQSFDEDLLFSLRTELQRRKKGGAFLEATNPFHGL